MNKRLSFIWILGASALMWTACDNGDACTTANDRVAMECGTDVGNWACGSAVADACNTCIQTHFDGAGGCGTALENACLSECCPPGTICSPSGGDAGMDDDAGMDADGGPPTPMCGAVGQIGGTCRGGTTCATGVTCFEELATVIMNPTLGNTFGFNEGTPDTANEGEFLSTGTPSDVPLNIAPGGLCSRGCQTGMGDSCGMCATCSQTVGDGALGGIGVQIGSFRTLYTDVTDANPGACRLNCQYDPATNGGCPAGYACDPSTNICLEACTTDSQCNLSIGLSEAEGAVATEVEGTPYTCNTTTGQCEWTAPAGAALQSECDDNSDCPSPGGICLLGGRCATVACSDASGTMAGPIACDGGACLGFGGNNGSICLAPCNTAADCFPGQACSPLTMALPTGETGVCFAVCENDGQCQSQERCQLVRPESSPGAGDDLRTCNPICDPDPSDGTTVEGAITCEADQACVQDGTNDWGYCEEQDQICFADEDCSGTQACRVNSDNLYGRCVDGCTMDTDCTGTDEVCVTQSGSTHGVCRAPGESCAPSPENASGAIIQPLRGDAQCATGETCSSTDPEMLGTCGT